MILISHRGNIDGPNKKLENSPEYLIMAINSGFDVEVDVWVLNNKIYTGHDGPEYLVDLSFLLDISDHAWFHCKNIDAIKFFIKNKISFKFFWHQNDDYALTSNKYIWTYPGKTTSDISILVDLNAEINYNDILVYGVCTDYPKKIRTV